MDSNLAIVLTGILVATACALPGAFLVLRKMAMMSDAISHAILPGIVAAYFLARGPNLLAGFIGAAVAALILVTLVEGLVRSKRLNNETAMGVVFPAMFALGTFVISKFFANVHIDTHAVLFGEIEFAGLDVLLIGPSTGSGQAINLGSQSLWVMGGLCAINLVFITLFYKELKLATFDAPLAAALGLSPVLVHYLLMATVSLTAVGAFTAVGAVLVIALMIVPAATAQLLTHRLPVMIILSVVIGAASAVLGFQLARTFDTAISGMMATVTGVFFALAVLFSPEHGLIARARRIGRNRVQFAVETLLVHLMTHERQTGEEHEAEVAHLSDELNWKPDFVRRILDAAQRAGYVVRESTALALTPQGREQAKVVLAR